MNNIITEGGFAVIMLYVVLHDFVLPAMKSRNGNGNGTTKAIADAVELERMRGDIKGLQAMKETVDAISEQILEFSKDHAEFVRAYTEKHALLSERITKVEAGR